MIGLAVVGPKFEFGHRTPFSTDQKLALILMVSRFVLFIQYGSALVFSWWYHAARMPLILIMTSLITAAIIYMGVSFGFEFEKSRHGHIAFYTVRAFEIIANLLISFWGKLISLRETKILERMNCLTLIVVSVPLRHPL